MDSLSIVLLAVGFVLIVLLLTLSIKLWRKNKRNQNIVNGTNLEFQVLSDSKKSLQRDLEKKIEKANHEKEQLANSLEAAIARYKVELKNAYNKISTLKTEALSLAEAKIDDDILKSKIEESKTYLFKINELQNELIEARAKLEKNEVELTTIEELKREKKNLKFELQEKHEESEEYWKKNKKLNKDLINLSEEKDRIEHISQKIKKKLENLENTYNDLNEIFKLKDEALNFVKEILNAKRTNDESIKELYNRVDSVEEFIRGEVHDSLISVNQYSENIKNKYFDHELKKWAITKKKSWIQGKITIAFVGEFSAGKTTIVNRILSQDDINAPQLPVSIRATTAIPTYITGGISTFYQFVSPDNELKGISEDTFKKVSKEVLAQIEGISSLIQYFVLTYNNPNLNRISILDTPGFSSGDKEDAERTVEVINECDALFWVMDVNYGSINNSSLKIIKEYLKKPLYIIINFIDSKSKEDVDAAEELIKETLNKHEIKYNGIIRFSKNEPITKIMGPISKIPYDSSKDNLIFDLIEELSSIEKNLKKETSKAHSASNKLQNQHEQLISDFEEKIFQIEEKSDRIFELPQYKKKIIGKGYYRISQDEFSNFEDILNELRNQNLDVLKDLYAKQIEIVSQLENSWEQHSEALKKEKIIRSVKEKMIKMDKKLKTVIPSSILSPESFSFKKDKDDNLDKIKESQSFSKKANDNVLSNILYTFTVNDILKDTIIDRKTKTWENSVKEERVKVDWENLLNNYQKLFDLSTTTSDLKKVINEYGTQKFIPLFNLKYPLEQAIRRQNLEVLVKSCKQKEGIPVESNITQADINIVLLINKVKKYYSVEVKQWQIFNENKKNVNLDNIVDVLLQKTIGQNTIADKQLYPLKTNFK